MRNGKANRNGSNGSNGVATRSRRGTSAVVSSQGGRLPVLKTYKIYVGGKFPRTESGRFYLVKRAGSDEALANVCLSSRKDFREAVVAARAAQGSWAGRAAFNRSQILYRIAEMMEGRAGQFVEEMVSQGYGAAEAKAEVEAAVDRWLYYAGWADKYQQIFSSVNPVASSHFNFSVVEPTGVVAILAPQETALIGLVSVMAPAICGGNAVVALASKQLPLCAVTLAEVLATSDLPGGVVNLLTGDRAELIEHFAGHMDVNAIVYCGEDEKERVAVRTKAAGNVKRAIVYDRKDWMAEEAEGPYFILDTLEVKTTWHPIGV